MCQKWPSVTTADVDNNMKEHFSPDLFSPLDIMEDRRLLRKLLHDCKVRYEREVERREANNSIPTVEPQDPTSSTPDAEVVGDPPTM
ncbi:unnamed protein product [Ectocarpus sp. 12 AP-2014]